jgi:hypothetical protein
LKHKIILKSLAASKPKDLNRKTKISLDYLTEENLAFNQREKNKV